MIINKISEVINNRMHLQWFKITAAYVYDLLRKHPLMFKFRKPIEVIETLQNSHIRENYIVLVI